MIEGLSTKESYTLGFFVQAKLSWCKIQITITFSFLYLDQESFQTIFTMPTTKYTQ